MPAKTEIEYLIILKNLNHLANREEQDEFELWLKADRKNRSYYKKLKADFENDSLNITRRDIEQSWNTISKTIKRDDKITLKRWLQYAAAILIPLGLTLMFMWMSDKEGYKQEAHHQIHSQVKPGASKAILQLSNGEIVRLDGQSKQLIQNEEGEIIGSDSSDVLSYNTNKSINTSEYNTISVPRGGVYQLILADETKVWLNSETVLSYPVAFADGSREVQLNGEAFFDVKADKERPFIVNAGSTAVKVYGTQFNVMCYGNDKLMETSLVEGSIAMLKGGNEMLIKPGEQAQITKASGNMIVRKINTDVYTAWKDGIFRFDEMTLGEMAVKLSRWYNVDFFFAGTEVKKKRFTGGVRRETEFDFFIKLIEESTKVKIEVNNNTVLVKALN